MRYISYYWLYEDENHQRGNKSGFARGGNPSARELLVILISYQFKVSGFEERRGENVK